MSSTTLFKVSLLTDTLFIIKYSFYGVSHLSKLNLLFLIHVAKIRIITITCNYFNAFVLIFNFYLS
nr:MAG TPA: hypothetical protein [Caudoviricetes sp.]